MKAVYCRMRREKNTFILLLISDESKFEGIFDGNGYVIKA